MKFLLKDNISIIKKVKVERKKIVLQMVALTCYMLVILDT